MGDTAQSALFSSALVVDAKVQRNPDGSAYVEIPISVESAHVDYSRTEGGGPKDGAMTLADLHEMEANLGAHPGPLPVGFGAHARDKGDASDAFLERVHIRGNTLWGRVWVSAAKAVEVLAGLWRGFSIEAVRPLKTATASVEGWNLTGGVFTNNPAFPIHFRIAASAGDPATSDVRHVVVNFRLSPEQIRLGTEPGGRSMAGETETISLTQHEAKLSEVKRALTLKTEEAESLSTQLVASREEVTRLRADGDKVASEAATVRAERDAMKIMATQHESQIASLKAAQATLSERVRELSEEKGKIEAELLGDRVKKLVAEAVAAGVPVAVFDGHEQAPAAWMTGKFTSFDAFKDFVQVLRGTASPKGVASVKAGNDPASRGGDSAGKTSLSNEEQAEFDRLGLGEPTYVGITTEEDARRAYLAAKRTSKKLEN